MSEDIKTPETLQKIEVNSIYKKQTLSGKTRYKRGVKYDLYNPPLYKAPGIEVCIAEDINTHEVICVKAISKKEKPIEILQEICRYKEAALFRKIFVQYLGEEASTASNSYFPLELCNAGSLSLYLGLCIGINEIRKIASFLGLAAEILHKSKKVHGFINPKNILINIDEHNQSYFKLSGWFVPNSKFDNSVDINYFAPELFQTHTLTPDTDMWSIGIVLFQLSTGKLPQELNPGFPTKTQKLNYSPNIDSELCDLIDKCLIIDPQFRIKPNEFLTHKFIISDQITDSLENDFLDFINLRLSKYNISAIEKRFNIEPYIFVEQIVQNDTEKYKICKWKTTDERQLLAKIINFDGITIDEGNNIVSELEVLLEFRNSAYFINVHDCFICENYLIIVMEWEQDFITLQDFFAKTKNGKSDTRLISPLNANSVAWGIACALREMHIKNYLYRNLSARYIILEVNKLTSLIRGVKLFNFVKCKLDGTQYELPYEFKNRIPPEMIFTKTGDVWVYGLLLFKLLFGMSLFKYADNNIQNVLAKHINFPISPAEEPELYELAISCLNTDYTKRPTFAEIVENKYFKTVPNRTQLKLPPYVISHKLKSFEDRNVVKYKGSREGSSDFYEIVVKENKNLSPDEKHKIMLMFRIGIFPYIKSLRDYFWINKTIHLVYDYFEGITLDSYIMTNFSKLTTKEIIECAHCVILALKHMHSKNIVYRNLRPENIIVLSDLNKPGESLFNIKLVGFSYAKALFSGETGKSLIIDPTTAVYFAPELLIMGVNSKADIWSYGMLLYFLQFGVHPLKYYVDGKPQNTHKDIYATGNVKHPAIIHGEELYEIMKKCLKIYPDERPNAEEILVNEIFSPKI